MNLWQHPLTCVPKFVLLPLLHPEIAMIVSSVIAAAPEAGSSFPPHKAGEVSLQLYLRHTLLVGYPTRRITVRFWPVQTR